MSAIQVQSAHVPSSNIESARNDLVLLGVASLGDLEGKEKTIRAQLQKTDYLYFAYVLGHEVDQTVPAPRMGYLPFITKLTNSLGDKAVDSTVAQMATDARLSVAVDTANDLIAENQNYDLTALTIAAWIKRANKAGYEVSVNDETLFGDLAADETFVATVGKYESLLEQKGVMAAMDTAMITKLCAGIPNIEVIPAMTGRYGLVQDPETNIITLRPQEAPSNAQAGQWHSYHASTPRLGDSMHGTDLSVVVPFKAVAPVVEEIEEPFDIGSTFGINFVVGKPSPVEPIPVVDLMSLHAGVPRAEMSGSLEPARTFQAQVRGARPAPTPARQQPEIVDIGSTYGVCSMK